MTFPICGFFSSAKAAPPRFKYKHFAESGSGSEGVLVFKAHRLVYHSTLGWGVIKKKKKTKCRTASPPSCICTPRSTLFFRVVVPTVSTTVGRRAPMRSLGLGAQESWMVLSSWVKTAASQTRMVRRQDRLGGNPEATRQFLKSTPIQRQPGRGSICGRLT